MRTLRRRTATSMYYFDYLNRLNRSKQRWNAALKWALGYNATGADLRLANRDQLLALSRYLKPLGSMHDTVFAYAENMRRKHGITP